MMNPAPRELLGKDRSTSETGHGPDEAMDGAQFRNVVGFLGRPPTIDRCVDAMGQLRSRSSSDHQTACALYVRLKRQGPLLSFGALQTE